MSERQRYINYLEGTIKDCKRHDRPTHLMAVSNMKHILELLKEPSLPEEPTEEMLAVLSNVTVHHDAMHPKYPFSYEAYKNLYAALSTPPAPKTKRVKVWRVEWWNIIARRTKSESFVMPDEAYNKQRHLQQLSPGHVSCINLIEDTQEVPDND